MNPDACDQAVELQLDDLSQMLILDGKHEGHVAYRFDDTWVCSCGRLVTLGA